MAGTGKPILVGSIIYLENKNPHSGYLDARGRVIDKPEFWNVAGTERSFVLTHGTPNRDQGSGSWKIISAEGKADGTPLKIGDTIHLLNMYPNVGYLDCCGWIEHLAPFHDYQTEVRCGVFTAVIPDRDNGTGKWTITSAEKLENDELLEGDVIYLDNGYPNTGSLVA
ncbi:MAG: hypothetical protein KC413_17550 [Anaerolineales bacterium]|nr:hypothetical protein [Anaerolineales bacterium]